MKVVFMGTPRIAEIALIELLRRSVEVVGVFTREDKPVGRKQVLTQPPVKIRALENNIPVFQPATMKDPAAIKALQSLAPDLVVVVAYGRLLPQEVLDIPTYGCINLHVSMLPAYRGAAPIQWAVINGEKSTGVTVMQMDAGLDTGAILAQQAVEIAPNATAGDVFELVEPIGARLLADTIEKLAAGQVQPVAQQGQASTAPALKKEMTQLDFNRSAQVLHNLIRGANPAPLAWFITNGKRVKVLKADLSDMQGKPGEVIALAPLTIACGQDALVLEHVVPEGSKAMAGAAFAAGRRFKAGDLL